MEGVFFMDSMNSGNEFNIYKDIQQRTGGEIYIGVVGPVRTGKSTFIKRFMDLMVIPEITDENEAVRARDELPQSSGGKTITTTEPKFIPKEAVEIELSEGIKSKVRLIDCVGYMVEGASGHMEDDEERMVKTPWYDYEIPFTKAAEVGTKKVINDHSTIGIVITTDGSFGDINRSAYVAPEEKTINELKKLHKPFVVLVNSEKPYSDEAKKAADDISAKYHVTATTVNCEQLKKEDIHRIMQNILMEFPLTKVEFYMPGWVEMLPENHEVKKELSERIKTMIQDIQVIKDSPKISIESDYIRNMKIDDINMSNGGVKISLDLDDSFYYDMLSEITGEMIDCDYRLMQVLKEMSKMKSEYGKVQNAMEAVRYKGYGVVMPERQEITLAEPEMIRHGNKFGVKIKAESPSIHMIRANIETEIAPIVGTEEQAKDLIQYIAKDEKEGSGIWDTNIFGKTVEQLVNDGISSKISMIGEESQLKLQDTMQKIVNDTNGGIVCIII